MVLALNCLGKNASFGIGRFFGGPSAVNPKAAIPANIRWSQRHNFGSDLREFGMSEACAGRSQTPA